jgi:hypothetical protein
VLGFLAKRIYVALTARFWTPSAKRAKQNNANMLGFLAGQSYVGF